MKLYNLHVEQLGQHPSSLPAQIKRISDSFSQIIDESNSEFYWRFVIYLPYYSDEMWSSFCITNIQSLKRDAYQAKIQDLANYTS